MNKSKIILDIDGVICDFNKGVIDRYFKEYGVLLKDDKWEFFPREFWGKIVNDKKFWLNLKPFQGADKYLEIVPAAYMTSRVIDRDITIRWLKKYGFPNADQVLISSNKADSMKSLFPDHLLVDDNVETIKNCVAGKVLCRLFTSGHHAEYAGTEDLRHLPRVRDIHQVNQLSDYIDNAIKQAGERMKAGLRGYKTL